MTRAPCCVLRRFPFALLACAAAALASPAAGAHDARPVSVNITEQSTDLYLARLRVPPTVAADNQPRLVWPADCRVLNDRLETDAASSSETALVECSGGLEGRHVAIRYAIYNPSLSTLFRLSALGGKVVTRVQPPDQLDWQVPEQPGWRQVAAGYLELGVQHIWTGPDHLLFVAGLLILAGTPRRILIAITGFTLAHSVTLSLATLGLVRLPVAPVEASIALSILVLAREIARPHPGGLAARYPIAVSSSFGLLHGFGFAAALREVGLPTRELAVGLFGFNLGVEIGQILFIAAALALVHAARLAAARRLLARTRGAWRWRTLGGYVLGISASFWFIQRLAAF
jgi:hydrogenase/urease accessory protein HupE